MFSADGGGAVVLEGEGDEGVIACLSLGRDNTAGITHSAYSTDADKGRVGELLRELPNLCVTNETEVTR